MIPLPPTPSAFRSHIHLLYVPTLHCNLGCRYCYLGQQTEGQPLKADDQRAADTLKRALAAFLGAGVLPFNVSLHGGEVTTLSPQTLAELFQIIHRHYLDHYDALTALGYRKSAPHLKTNLFNFHRLYDLFDAHRVSLSASIDLPLALHGQYRTTRAGENWLPRTLENLRLLARYPHAKKISATLYREHLQDSTALFADIWRIHREVGFDMNHFNFMFGFGSRFNQARLRGQGLVELQPVPEALQASFYAAAKAAFTGTELEEGFLRNWFDEFKPSYCTNAFNCGERFFLLQGDGTFYSCVRGQGLEPFRYGNLFEDRIEDILENGRRKISLVHQQAGFAPQCRSCDHLHLCHTGCPVVKHQSGQAASYTCALQKAIYHDHPRSFPAARDQAHQRILTYEYASGMHPAVAQTMSPPQRALPLPRDLNEEKNQLAALLQADPILQELYTENGVVLELNGEAIPLTSQILKTTRDLYTLGPADNVKLLLRRSLFDAACPELVRNTLYLQLLRDTPVTYGEERRTKQEHLFTYQLYYAQLQPVDFNGQPFLQADLGGLLALHQELFRKGVLNNLLVTTSFLRDYHYQCQKQNAFYHIQAINLPFQNFEFYWLTPAIAQPYESK